MKPVQASRDVVAAEAKRRAALLPDDEPARRPVRRARASRASASERRTICALKAPARPRSPVSGEDRDGLASSRSSRSGKPRDGVARAVPIISSRIRSAYGRSASMRASARRSFAAATSSIAFVILRVFRPSGRGA